MRQRWVLIAILAAAIVSFASLAAIPSVSQRAGISWTPSFVGFVILVLAVTGHKLPWAIAWVWSLILASALIWLCLADLANHQRSALAGVAVIVSLALWALKPEEPPAPSSQG